MIYLDRVRENYVSFIIDNEKSDYRTSCIIAIHPIRWRLMLRRRLPEPNSHKRRWWFGPIEIEISNFRKLTK